MTFKLKKVPSISTVRAYFVFAPLGFTYTAVRLVQEKSVKLAINTDAPDSSQFDAIAYGIGIARRGGVEAPSVINTLPFAQLRKTLKHVK